ncbi:TPA: hypothetical protein N0F65_000207 [Lagenidium giganteum]|uniref:CID domain-containing protein n=1 Tax=Lagenidium giganteum TaxID=4803 RepID=A0AAV2YG99_9STRA|nr:TPA: hypothetical protein N0F65_000207 [Lagenidium giganteum]
MAAAQYAANDSNRMAAAAPMPSVPTEPRRMAQAGSEPAPNAGGAARAGEVKALLGQFDAMINQMGAYPAKDIINSLTMLAERAAFPSEIVSFLETKIHRVAPNFKLPIFYLMDSILKNVKGAYPELFGRIIVPLYCNCVRQVDGKDLRRFIHVLNTWEASRLFVRDAIAQMRAAASRAEAAAGPSVMAQPASFSQDPEAQRRAAMGGPGVPGNAPTMAPTGARAPPPRGPAPPSGDMELRSLLTQLQNEMGIHPTEHMSLEEVRTNNPEYYSQLLAFQAQSRGRGAPPTSAPAPAPMAAPPHSHQGMPMGGPGPSGPPQRGPRKDPRARGGRGGGGNGGGGGGGPSRYGPGPPDRDGGRGRGGQGMHAGGRGPPRSPPSRSGGGGRSASGAGPAPTPAAGAPAPAKSSNVAHLMQLLKSKKKPASPPQQFAEITNDPVVRTPDPMAVMSILQKLKGMSGNSAPPPPPPGHSAGDPRRGGGAQPPPHHQHHHQPQHQVPQPPARTFNDAGASKMWFSDKIVAHKERVESHVQKLYAALPLVCRESGLRFKEQSKLDAHLDFLFQYNRAQKERGKGGTSRSWYPDADLWVSDVSSDNVPRESTSSSFFVRKESEEDINDSLDKARVPVDEAVTKCRICGDNFSKCWDEEEEEWMYTNAVIGTIHDGGATQETIFHKYCYDTVMTNSKQITLEHLIPETPQKPGSAMNCGEEETTGIKRALEDDSESDDDDDDVKRARTD